MRRFCSTQNRSFIAATLGQSRRANAIKSSRRMPFEDNRLGFHSRRKQKHAKRKAEGHAYAQFARRLTSGSIEVTLLCMRTTLDIPEPLIEEARQLLGFKSKTDTIVVSLQELIRRKRIDQLKAMMGHVKLEIDLPKSRRRSRS